MAEQTEFYNPPILTPSDQRFLFALNDKELEEVKYPPAPHEARHYLTLIHRGTQNSGFEFQSQDSHDKNENVVIQ